jgi:3-hydroxybutyryl-CoA dehydrogenase
VTEVPSDSGIAIVGIIGAGTMGTGFAQVALEAGREVVLYDVDPDALERASARIRDGLARRSRRLDPAPASIDDWVDERVAGLRQASTLVEVATEADLVIEAALEDLELKRTIFRALDAEAEPEVILATNTSALSVAEIAAATERPGRVLGLHGFNPVPLMALVEVVATPLTDPDVVARAVAEVRAWGKSPVLCTDTPGFIVNRVNRPFTIEALCILEDGEAGIETIDAALREAGYPMGPFELMDLSGLDVNLAAATGVWEGLGRPDRLRPSPIQERLVAAGHLGRKTGRGFYAYDQDGHATGLAKTDDPPPARGAQTLTRDAIRDRILAAVAAEAQLAVAEGVASEAAVDEALRLGANHPIGPFERVRGLSRD